MMASSVQLQYQSNSAQPQMSPLDILATSCTMYQHQPFMPAHSQISPTSTTSCSSDGYVSQVPLETTRSPLEFSPHYQPTYSYSNQYWFHQHSPPPADIATSGYQPHHHHHHHQQHQQYHQWPQTNYIPSPLAKMKAEMAMNVEPWTSLAYSSTASSKARRCIKCTCPNCADEGIGIRRSNSSKKVHVCHYQGCDKVYGKTSHLQAHIRWHTGERPFICKWIFCNKRFTRSDELQRHIRTHTGEKRFACTICTKRFMRSDHLAKHTKTHKNSAKKSGESNSESGRGASSEEKTKNVPYYGGDIAPTIVPSPTMYSGYNISAVSQYSSAIRSN